MIFNLSLMHQPHLGKIWHFNSYPFIFHSVIYLVLPRCHVLATHMIAKFQGYRTDTQSSYSLLMKGKCLSIQGLFFHLFSPLSLLNHCVTAINTKCSKGFATKITYPQAFLLWRRGLRSCSCVCDDKGLIPNQAQWVKNLALPQLVQSRLQFRFDPWPGNFHIPWVWPKKLKIKKKKDNVPVYFMHRKLRIQLSSS